MKDVFYVVVLIPLVLFLAFFLAFLPILPFDRLYIPSAASVTCSTIDIEGGTRTFCSGGFVR